MTFSSSPGLPPDEAQRLDALRRYNILDTPPEDGFDRVTRLAAQVLDVPIALITFVDADRQWFKSAVGLDDDASRTTSREIAFCARNIDDAATLVVEDLTRDPRFAQNPLVTGEDAIRFYAGAPLVTPDGYVLGSLCVLDTAPRSLDEREQRALEDLAALAMDELELRREVARRTQTHQYASQRQQILQQIAGGAALHDTLAAIVRHIESQAEDVLGSVLLYDAREGVIRHAAAPSLPEAYNTAIDGEAVGPAAGSCGTALHRGEPVVVEDIAEDPLWEDYRDVALAHDLRACWSVPIRGTQDDLLGTFAFYYRTPHTPTDREDRLHEDAQHLARIAIERTREREQLQQREERFRLLFHDNPLPMWVYDRDTLRFLAVNEAAIDQYGYSAAEFQSMTLRDIRPAEDVPRLMDNLSQERPTLERSTGWRHRRKDGSLLTVDIVSHEMDFDGAEAVLVVAKDVTDRVRAQQALREREEHLSVTLNSIGDAVIATDAEGCITEMNDVAERLTGWDRDAVRGMPLADIFQIHNAQTGAPVESPVEEVLRKGKIVGLANHTVLTGRNGEQRQIADSAAPIRTEDGTLVGVVLVFRDVTEQYEQRQALRAERDLLARIFDTTAAAITVLDAEGTIIRANARAEDVLGLSPSGVESRTYNDPQWDHEAVDGSPFPDAEQPFVRVMETGEPVFDVQHAIRWPSGERRILSISGGPLRDEDGAVTGCVFIINDITEQKEREQALQQRTIALEQAQAITRTGYGTIDLERGTIQMSPEAGRLLGLDASEAQPVEAFMELVHPDDLAMVTREFERVANGELHDEEYRITPAGHDETRWIRGQGYPQTDENGTVTRVFSTIADITEQKEREQARRESQERLALALASANLGLWDWQVQSGEVVFSEEWTDMLGYGSGEIAPSFESWRSLLHPEDAPRVTRTLEAHLRGETDMYETTYRMRAKDGSWRWILDLGRVVERAEDGTPLRATGIHHDITDRKRMEQRLQAQERMYRELVQTTSAILWRGNPETFQFTYVSPQAEDILGYSPEAWTETPDFWVNHIHPDDREWATAYCAQATQEMRRHSFDYRMLAANGDVVWLQDIVTVIEENGEPVELVGVMIDITERKRTEQKLVEAKEEAEQMNRLKSAFLANMSHEIRTPLTSIIGFAEVMAEMELGDAAARFATLIDRSGQRLLTTLNSVLDLSQLESGAMQLHPARVDCAMEVRGVVESFSTQAARSEVFLALDAPSHPVWVETDPSALQRVLTNLVSNALKFTGEGGRVDVALAPAGDALTLTVADTGIGIDPDFVPHLFEAFKQESTGSGRMFEGNGLGLAITRQLVRLMDGTIEVESTKGEGTTFTVTLPKAPADAAAPGGNAASPGADA